MSQARVSRSVKTGKINFAVIASFFIGVWAELKKVIWPGKREVFSSTILVILSIAAVAVFIAILDIVYGRIFSYLEVGSRLIG